MGIAFDTHALLSLLSSILNYLNAFNALIYYR